MAGRRGGQAWIFFEYAISAALARRLGSHLLTETMEGPPDVDLDSYDRLFPNQDTLPQGGFGNLLALPCLYRRVRGNAVIAPFWTSVSYRGPTGGRFWRAYARPDARNWPISADVLESVNAGRSPLVLTERNDHLDRLERELAQSVRHLVVLRAGMGKK